MDVPSDAAVWRRAREAFDAVASLAPAERAARLADLCGDAPEVMREVESLLAHLDSSDDTIPSVVSSAALAVADDDAAFHAGQEILHYGLHSRIGDGSMGTVWRATDHTLGRDVAIKVLPSTFASHPSRVARFEHEAKTLASLNHPNIAAIYSVHHADGVRFLAMEFVDGDDLTVPIARGPMPVERVVAIATQIATGLEEAHAKGIVHRDLKPANVKVRRDGTVKVLDFGLAKAIAGDPTVDAAAGDERSSRVPRSPVETRAGALLGTAAYMPPEQALGRPVDARADIWAFGAIVFEMLSGRRPFVGSTVTDVLSAVVAAEPDWSLLPVATPPALVRLVQRCLEKDVQLRLRDIGEARRELEQLQRQALPPATITGPASRGRDRLWALAAAIVAVAALSTIAWLRWPTGGVPLDGKRPLVAVRAFRNLSSDTAHASLATALSEEISGRLSQVSALQLLSGGALARDVDADTQRMASMFGVGSVVDGSVRIVGNTVHVTVQLTDATDRQTLWSNTYDRDLADVFAVQSDVALQVARATQVTVTPGERQRIEKRPTNNLEAYELYLRWRQTTAKTRDEWQTNLGVLRQAIALDPAFATARANLAYSLIFRSPFYDDGAALLAEGMAEAEAALKEDSSLAVAHSALATGYAIRGVASQARLSFQRALTLNRNDNLGMTNLSYLELYFGRFVDSLDWARRAFVVSSRQGNDYFHVSAPLISLRDDALSWRWLSDAERVADDHRVQQQLALVEVFLGRDRNATDRLTRAATAEPSNVEIIQTRSELAFLLDSAEQEALVEPLMNGSAGTMSVWVAETPRVRYAHALAKRGESARAAALVAEAERAVTIRIDGGDEMPMWRVELAAIQALKKDDAASLAALARAYDAGYREYGHLERDPIFAPLRRNARFTALLDRMRRDVEIQRQSAGERGLLDIDALLTRSK